MGYPQGTASPTPPLNGHKKWRCGVCVSVHITGGLCPIHAHFRAMMPETLGESMPPSPTVGASVQKRKAEDRLETDIQQRSRRRARHAREYELICLLQQRLRAVSWPHWRLSAACSHCSAAAWDLSGLDHSHAATPQRVTRASCVSSCVLCLAPSAVDLLEALGRCVCARRACACCFCLRISHFCCFR